MKRELQRKSIRLLCDTSAWRSVVALTLNLKKTIQTPNGGIVTIDELQAKAAFKRYLNRLNRRIYGSAHRHHDRRLLTIPILERSHDGRWHYHVAIQPPTFMTSAEFAQIADVLWTSSPSGYGYGAIELEADEGWLAYITKYRTKGHFEQLFDCLDLDAYYNPLASA